MNSDTRFKIQRLENQMTQLKTTVTSNSETINKLVSQNKEILDTLLEIKVEIDILKDGGNI